MIKLDTARLKLVASTIELAEAEIKDKSNFSKLVNAEIPGNWPPPLNDEDSMNWNLSFLLNNRNKVGWSLWYFLLKGSNKNYLAIGNGGFKGSPDFEGHVEIGYSILEEHQKKGYATEAVKSLMNWAFSNSKVRSIFAHTLPELTASIKVLEKCGFIFIGEGLEIDTIMFEKKRHF